MNAPALLTNRLARSDMAQILTLFLAVMVVVLGISWPSAGSFANESWFSLAPARNAFLALAAAGFGASQGLLGVQGPHVRPRSYAEWLTEARFTLLALLVWVLLTMPFEFISHAASFPAVSAWYSLVMSLITVPAYYGLGMLLRKVCLTLRVPWLLTLAVPAVILVLAWLDLQLDVTFFNPWTAALAPSPYPAVMGLAALLTVLYLVAAPRLRRRAATRQGLKAARPHEDEA